MASVFVTRRLFGDALERLMAAHEVTVWEGDGPPSAAELRSCAAGADGLLSLLTDRVDEALLGACPRLRVVANYAVGTDNVDLAACAARGVAVGRTPDVLTDATADLTWALLLAVARQLPEAAAAVRGDAYRPAASSNVSPGGKPTTPPDHPGAAYRPQTPSDVSPEGKRAPAPAATEAPAGAAAYRPQTPSGALHGGKRDSVAPATWRTWEPRGWLGTGLAGKRLLVFGPGRIGQAVARRAEGFGMDVVFARRGDDLHAALAGADVVSIHAPLTDATRHAFDAAAFAAVKPGAILVNTARGGLIDQVALADALRSGHLAGAGLDVTDPEPLPPDDPLRKAPNLLVLPHIGSATFEARAAMTRICVDNLDAGLAGRPLPHPA